MTKWGFFSIAAVCITIVTVVDKLFPDYEDD